MDADIVVVGGGIVGASVAYHLSEKRKVILLEAEDQPGYHATGRSAAVFSETYGSEAIRALTFRSRPFLDDPPDGFGETPLLTPRGELIVARELDLPVLEATHMGVSTLNQRVVRLTGKEAQEIVPALRPGLVAAALHDPGAMDLNVAALHQGFLAGVKRGGGQIATSARAEAIERADGRFVIETRSARFSAPIVVNAAGAWAEDVGELAGARSLRIMPFRRTAVLVDVPEGIDFTHWPLTFEVSETFYAKPEAGLLLVSPADETPSEPVDAQPDEFDVALAVDRAQGVFDFPITRVRRKWAGLRTFAPDRSPVVGFDPEVEGLFWAAGVGGYGVQTAPAIGRAAASLVETGRLPVELEEHFTHDVISPARFRTSR